MFRFPKSVVPATPKIGCYPCLGARTCHFCCSQLLRLWGCSCSFLSFICHPWWHIQPLSQRRKKKKKTFKNPVTMKTFFDLSTTTMITAYRLTYTIIPQKKSLWPKICATILLLQVAQLRPHLKRPATRKAFRISSVQIAWEMVASYETEPISPSQTTGGTSKLKGICLTTIIPNHPFIRALLGSYFLAIGRGLPSEIPVTIDWRNNKNDWDFFRHIYTYFILAFLYTVVFLWKKNRENSNESSNTANTSKETLKWSCSKKKLLDGSMIFPGPKKAAVLSSGNGFLQQKNDPPSNSTQTVVGWIGQG